MKIYCAPLQGFTEAAWRNAHAEVYNPGVVYFTPFLRVEHGQVRSRDIKDVTSAFNSNHTVIPQMIFKNCDEFALLVDTLHGLGAKRVDLNLGCPFPPQCSKGRGAAMLLNTQCLARLRDLMKQYTSITFSVKMRLGVDSPHQWESATSFINDMPLSHITVHPRIAVQQYKGEVFLDEFEKLLSRTSHPVIYNGDIVSVDSYNGIVARFPQIKGVMIGRGVVARPSLINELLEGNEWPRSRRIDCLLMMHNRLLSIYESILCGEAQVLSKIQPYWAYMGDEIEKKILKRIAKAKDLERYKQAVAMVR